MTQVHPTFDELRDFASGRIEDEQRQHRIEDHVLVCDECCQALQSGGADELEEQLAGLPQDQWPTAARKRYELLDEIGRGGAGIVYRARQTDLPRDVALKMLLGGARSSPAQLARFRRESAALARLSHSHIVQIHEYGELDGAPFLALEYVSGPSLAQRLAEGPLNVRVAAQWVRALADAVACAHGEGIFHRDLKPQNVLLAPAHSNIGQRSEKPVAWPQAGASNDLTWQPKLVDFGLTMATDDTYFQTATGETLGTPAFMAPEAIGPDSASCPGAAIDIYGLGAILYACLTGHPPHTGSSTWEILEAVAHRNLVTITSLRAGVPTDLVTICMRCLDKRPERRFVSATELADDLDRFLDGRPILSRRIGPLEKALRWARRKPAAATATTLAIALSIVVPLLLLWQNAAVLQERNLAQEQYQATRDTLQVMIDELQADREEPIPELSRLGLRQLEHASALLERLATADMSPSGYLEWANVLLDKGSAEIALNELNEAADSINQAEILLRNQIHHPDSRQAALFGLFAMHIKRAVLFSDLGDFDAADADLTEAKSIHKQLTLEFPDELKQQPDLAWLLHNLGVTTQGRGQLEQAADYYLEALQIYDAQMAQQPDNLDLMQKAAGTRINLATVQMQIPQNEAASANYRIALGLLERYGEHKHVPADWLEDWSTGILNYSNLLNATDRPDEAYAQLNRARSKLLSAIELDPDRIVLRNNLFMVSANRAMFCPDPSHEPSCWRDALHAANQPDWNIFARQMLVRSLILVGETEPADKELARLNAANLNPQQRFVLASCHALLAKQITETPADVSDLKKIQQCQNAWEVLIQLAAIGELKNPERIEHLQTSDEWDAVRTFAGSSAWNNLINPQSKPP